MIRALSAAEVAAALPDREYRRLLQWPRDRDWPNELRLRAQGARDWYALNGRPFLAARRAGLRAADAAPLQLETGVELQDPSVAAGLRAAEACAVVVVVASAGHEVAAESARRWEAGLPDEGYFLDRLAVGIAQALLAHAATELCRELTPQGEHLLPHHSPGCGGWDISDQHGLMALLGDAAGPVSLLESGALRPQHSVLALFGVSHRPSGTANPAAACGRCDLEPCAFRRMPFQCDASPP